MREDEVDRLILSSMGGCVRRVSNTWINPAKSRVYYEDLRRVFFKDESPEGLYPTCVVPETLLGKTVVVPAEKFTALLEAWKNLHSSYVKRLKKMTEEKR